MAGNGRKRLDSWKDIAQHLGRDLSTVRRWEKERGLPVHRLPGAARSAVFAYADEIDTWRVGQPPEANTGKKATQVRWMAAAFLAVSLLGLTGLWAWRGTAPRYIERAEFQGQRLLAYDSSGRVAWYHAFPAALDIPEGQVSRRLHVVGRDGEREIVVGVRFAGTEEEEVYSFSNEGAVRWRYRPTETLRFGGEPFTGPWRIGDVLIEEDGQATWVAFTHHTWWPSFVVRIDEQGRGDIRFVSTGWVTELELFRNGSGSYIVAGGLNNEYDAGALAILDPTRPAARSPQTPDSPYTCISCPTAQPHRYFVFPRSELNTVTGSPANIVRMIRTLPDKLEVRTEEVNDSSVQSFGVYELRGDFSLAAASVTDLYWDLHRRLEKEGRISHTADTCRRERSFSDKIRVWRGDGTEHASLK